MRACFNTSINFARCYWPTLKNRDSIWTKGLPKDLINFLNWLNLIPILLWMGKYNTPKDILPFLFKTLSVSLIKSWNYDINKINMGHEKKFLYKIILNFGYLWRKARLAIKKKKHKQFLLQDHQLAEKLIFDLGFFEKKKEIKVYSWLNF